MNEIIWHARKRKEGPHYFHKQSRFLSDAMKDKMDNTKRYNIYAFIIDSFSYISFL